LEKQLWNEWDQNTSKWIPVYIPLRSLTEEQIKNGLIEEILMNRVGLDSNSLESLQNPSQQQQQQLLFILDGYDELSDTLRQQLCQSRQSNLYFGNKFNAFNHCKIVITCRDTCCRDIRFDSCISSNDIEKAVSPDPKWFQEVYIAPFGKEQIKEFLSKFLQYYPEKADTKWSVEQFMEHIGMIESLQTLVKIPIFLRIIVEVLPRVTPDGSNKKWDIGINKLFVCFLDHFFHRQYQQLKESMMMMIMNEDDAVRSFWDYALLLAKRMEHENKSSFTYFPQIRSGLKKKPVELSYWHQVFYNAEEYPTNEHSFVWRALPLCRVRGMKNTFSFLHLHLQQFLGHYYMARLYEMERTVSEESCQASSNLQSIDPQISITVEG